VVWLDFLTGVYGGREEGLAAEQAMADLNPEALVAAPPSKSPVLPLAPLIGLLGGTVTGYAVAANTAVWVKRPIVVWGA